MMAGTFIFGSLIYSEHRVESVANQQNKNKCVEYFKRYSETCLR
jgi:hypothetical protein